MKQLNFPEPDAKDKASFYTQSFNKESNIVKQVAEMNKDFGEKFPHVVID